MFSTPSDYPSKQTRQPRARWPGTALLWGTLLLAGMGAGLEFARAGVTSASLVCLAVVGFNLVTLVSPRRWQRTLRAAAPYLYLSFLLSGWVYAFYFSYPSRLAQACILTAVLLLPVLYAQFFDRLPGPQALLQAGVTLLSFSLLNLPHALISIGSPNLFDGLAFLALFTASHSLLLAFVSASMWTDGELSHLRQDAAWFQRLANHDFLTDLPNRRQLEQVLSVSLSQADRHNTPCAALVIDIDHFKRLNDRFGHPVGDKVLKEISRRLQHELRAGSTLGRWGGEEFVVVAPQTELHEAQQLGERLLYAVRADPISGEHLVTVSIGVAAYRPGDTPETLIARADRALYRAKQAGRDRLAA